MRARFVAPRGLGGNGGQVCEICHSGGFPERMLLCDGCDLGYAFVSLCIPLSMADHSTRRLVFVPCLPGSGSTWTA